MEFINITPSLNIERRFSSDKLQGECSNTPDIAGLVNVNTSASNIFWCYPKAAIIVIHLIFVKPLQQSMDQQAVTAISDFCCAVRVRQNIRRTELADVSSWLLYFDVLRVEIIYSFDDLRDQSRNSVFLQAVWMPSDVLA